MLTELTIRNFAIIDELKVAFGEGLNILSGETGAGKSIIIGAIGLLLGDRASSDMIRTSEDSATVEACFDLKDRQRLISELEGMGFLDGNDLVIKRIISRSGKSRVYINSHAATLGVLSTLGESLMNICGQHEHQVLLREENHVDILDEFGNLLALRQAYELAHEEVQALKEKISHLHDLKRRKLEREEYLNFQLSEIMDLDPQPEEDTALLEEKKILNNVQKLSDSAMMAYETLYTGEGSVIEKLRGVLDAVRDIHRIDSRLAVSQEEMSAQYYQLEEAAFAIRNYAGGLSFDAARLEVIDDRLERLGRLKRKHGGSLEGILAKKAEMELELKKMQDADEALSTMMEKMESATKIMAAKAAELSGQRREAALKLERAIEEEIQTLRMPGARFKIIFRDGASPENGDRYGQKGIDDVAFYLSTNPGEDLKPLNRVASGGELSRVVLAMKRVLAGVGFDGTIVFDEVDSGIGGAVAEVIGEKIREVARRHQVLCITHLPQIACFGDTHYRVVKRIAEEKTITGVELLSDEERHEEIARMLGGIDVTETTRKHAQEMLFATGRKQ